MSLEALYKSYGHEFQPNPVENTNQNVEPIPENPEHTLGERLWQGAQGLAEFGGSLADIGAKTQGYQVESAVNSRGNDKRQLQSQEIIKGLKNTNYQEKGHNLVNKLAGRDVTPGEEDTTGKIVKEAAPLLAPGPGELKLLGSSVKGALKWAAKHTAGAFGAATALHATPRIAEEGGFGGTVEDLAKMIVGSKASALPGKSREMAKKILESAKSGSYKNIPAKMAGKVLSYGAKLDSEFSEFAKKHNVIVPYNVEAGKQGKFQGLLANTYLKSAFVAKIFNDMIENSSQSMIDAVKKSINTLGERNVQPTEGSREFASFLKNRHSEGEQISHRLSEKAISHLSDADKIVPKHSLDALEDFSKIFSTKDVNAPDTKAASKIVAELLENWGKLDKSITPAMVEENPKLLISSLDAILSEREKVRILRAQRKLREKNFKDNNHKPEQLDYSEKRTLPVDIKKLVGTRTEIGKMTNFGENVKHSKGMLNKLYSAITKDVRSSPNKKFVKDWDIATKYRRQQFEEILQTDLAASIMRGEAPVEAYNKLNSVQGIDDLEKMVGKSKNGAEIFNALKKAKVKEIINKATNGGIENGEIKTKAFADIFTGNEANKEVLERLTGKETYKNLEELGKVSKRFSDAGQVLFNTSGTAPASADIAKFEKIATTTLKYVLNGGILAGGAAIAGPLGALGSAAIPNIISRIVVNKNVIGEMKRYALAREAGKVKQAETIGNRLIRMVSKEVKALEYEAKHKVSGEKEEKK